MMTLLHELQASVFFPPFLLVIPASLILVMISVRVNAPGAFIVILAMLPLVCQMPLPSEHASQT